MMETMLVEKLSRQEFQRLLKSAAGMFEGVESNGSMDKLTKGEFELGALERIRNSRNWGFGVLSGRSVMKCSVDFR